MPFFTWPPAGRPTDPAPTNEMNQTRPITQDEVDRLYEQYRQTMHVSPPQTIENGQMYRWTYNPIDPYSAGQWTEADTAHLTQYDTSCDPEPPATVQVLNGTLEGLEVTIGEGNMPIVRAAKKKITEDGSVEEKKVKKKKDPLVEVVKEMDTVWADFLMRLKVSFGSHSMGREDWDMFFSENCFFGPDYFIEALSPKRNLTGKTKTPILFFKTKAAMDKAHDMFLIRRHDFVRYTFEEPLGRCFMTQFMKENIFFSVDLYGSPEEVMKKTANLTLEDCFYEVSSGRYHVNAYLLNKQVSFNSVEEAGDCAFSTTVLGKAFEFMQRGFVMSQGSYQWYINGLIGQENKNAIIRFKRQNNIRLPSDENDGVLLTNIAHPSAAEMPVIPGSGPRLRPTRRSMAQTRGALPEPNSNF